MKLIHVSRTGVWLYLIVAALIAAIAFAIGQVAPGLGVAFVALASTIWTAYSVNRQGIRTELAERPV